MFYNFKSSLHQWQTGNPGLVLFQINTTITPIYKQLGERTNLISEVENNQILIFLY